jgi:DNA-binding protein Fis
MNVTIKPVSLNELEKRHVEYIFEINRGNQEKTAEMLGISGSALYEKLRQYDLIKS